MKNLQVGAVIDHQSTGRTQWNTRVRPDFKRMAKLSAAVIDGSQDDVVELAMLALVGLDGGPGSRSGAQENKTIFLRCRTN